MNRTYTFQIKPTSRQAASLDRMIEGQRLLYNHLLEIRKTAWDDRLETVSTYDTVKMLPDLKHTDEWSFLNEFSAGMSQETALRLGRAFDAFFRRVKNGETPGYPRFRGKGWFNTVRLDHGKGGVKWDSTYTGRKVPSNRGLSRKKSTVTIYIQGVGHVKVNQHRPISGTPTVIDITRRTRGRWTVSVVCKDIESQPIAPTGHEVGIDLGVTHFVATSDGGLIENQRFMVSQAEKVAEAQREVARKEKGSNRRRKAKERLGRLKEKEADQRKDHHRKVANQLVQSADVIYAEKLSVKRMLESEGSHGKMAKTGLNRSMSDVAWSQFIGILTNKAESAGRSVVLVNPEYTSQTCRNCHHVNRENRSGDRFRCVACGYTGNADVLAAQNIKDRGQGLTSSDGYLYPVESAGTAGAEAVAFRRPE